MINKKKNFNQNTEECILLDNHNQIILHVINLYKMKKQLQGY